MIQVDAIRMLRDAYKGILYSPVGCWNPYVWARTLGTLQIAKEQVIAESKTTEGI